MDNSNHGVKIVDVAGVSANPYKAKTRNGPPTKPPIANARPLRLANLSSMDHPPMYPPNQNPAPDKRTINGSANSVLPQTANMHTIRKKLEKIKPNANPNTAFRRGRPSGIQRRNIKGPTAPVVAIPRGNPIHPSSKSSKTANPAKAPTANPSAPRRASLLTAVGVEMKAPRREAATIGIVVHLNPS